MNEYEDIDEEMLWGVVEETAPITTQERLPQIIREFQKDATQFSHGNEIPAAMAFCAMVSAPV